MQLSNIKNSLPGWLKYGIVVYLLSILPYWLMFRSGDSESAWGYLVRLAPGLAAFMLGLVKKHRLKYIAWWPGEMRFWLVALSLPLLVETLTIIVAIFLQLGELNSAVLGVDEGQAVSEAIRLPFGVATGSPWVALFNLLVAGAVASAFYFPFAMAEELGWRGTLHLQCATRFGFLKGAVLVGLIWGVWQAPAIIMSDSFSQFSIHGALARTMVSAIAFSILLGYLYEQSGSIWIPALLHASLNSVHGVHLVALAEKGNEFHIELLWTGLWVIVAEICLWFWAKSNR